MTPKGQKQKPRRWKHQSIDIDQHKLDALYEGNVRNYLYHEDPEYRAFINSQHRARHKIKMKTDPEYYNRHKRAFVSITPERLEKNRLAQRERIKKNPEYFIYKWRAYYDPSLNPNYRPPKLQSRLPYGLELRELDYINDTKGW